MTHQSQMLDAQDKHIGDLYFNDDGESYTAIMQEKDSEEALLEWWNDNLFGTPEVVGLTERQDLQCYLIHVK